MHTDLVHAQRGLRAEGLAAGGAGVRALARVQRGVPHQTHHRAERLPTLPTRVRLLPRVDPLVVLKQ